MKEIIEKIIKNQIFQSAEIKTADIPFSEDVLNACKLNHCGRYNTNWTCPPASGDLGSVKKSVLSFKKAFIFNRVYKLEDSFDIEGMDNARDEINNLCDKVIDYLIENNIKYKMLKAGSCNICKVCAYPDKPCRHKDKACLSLEACGINVVDLAKQNGMNYFNGNNTVTYFAIVLYN